MWLRLTKDNLLLLFNRDCPYILEFSFDQYITVWSYMRENIRSMQRKVFKSYGALFCITENHFENLDCEYATFLLENLPVSACFNGKLKQMRHEHYRW